MNTLSQINNLAPGQIGPIKLICDGIYSADAIAPTGEPMYFAMESIEDADKNKWNTYKKMARLLVYGDCGEKFTIGSFIELGARINDEIALKEFLAEKTHPNYWTIDLPKFEQLSAKLRERMIVIGGPKAEDLSVVAYASYGMDVNKQTHVVYVSKSPVAGRINFTSSSEGFGHYVESYGDVIMSVGVTVSDVVENRGIFRNPWSVVEGGYGGIAMMVHSFTCMAIEDNWPSVKTFKVHPLKKMGEIFLNSLPKDQVTINGIRGDIYDKGFITEQKVQVPIEILANLHRASGTH